MSVLWEKISSKRARLCVVGLGYVGLPLAVEKAKAGYTVMGIDVNPSRVEMVNKGINYIGDVVDAELSDIVLKGRLFASGGFESVDAADCVCLCVPTPLDRHQQPDVSYVVGSVRSLLPHLHPGMLIILESTTYPGTTRELILPMLEGSGLRCGEDFFLAFSPERVDPGNRSYQTKNTPKVVGGVTPECTRLAALLYERVLDAPVHTVSSPEVAEMEKLLENVYRNVNIALVNELAMLCHRAGIDVWEVIEAAKTKPYGFAAFYPGPGPGGHCIPLDPYYLSWKAREYGFHTSLIEASGMINDRMPEYCVGRAAKLLGEKRLSLRGSRVLLLGLAYKGNIPDYRESPAVKVLELLLKEGAELRFHDPYLPSVKTCFGVLGGEEALGVPLLEWADLVMVTAAHANVDYQLVADHASCVFDTKNAMAKVSGRERIHLL